MNFQKPSKFLRLALFCGLTVTFWLVQETVGSAVAVASCLILVSSCLLVSRSCYVLNLRRGTITAFWYVTYLAMIFFPSFLVYADQEGLYRSTYLFGVESVLITVPFGWWLANIWLRFRKEEIDAFFEKPIEDSVADSLIVQRWWVVCGLCLLATGAYLAEVKAVPLLYLLRNPGEAFEAALLREESFKLLDSPLTYVYQFVRALLYPILILIGLGYYLRFRQRRWLVMLLVASAAGLFFASLSLAKTPVAMIAVSIGIFMYLFNHGIITRKALTIVLVLVLLFPIFVVTIANSNDSIDPLLAVGAIGVRLFYIPAEVVYYYFEFFPAQVNYLHGRSIDKFARLMGESPYDPTNEVGNYAFYSGIDSVSANSAFIGDMNADFGMGGVLVGGVLTGIIMQTVQIFLLRRRKTVVTLACFSFLSFAFWQLNSTSLPIVLASDGVFLALLLAWYLERFENDHIVMSQPARGSAGTDSSR